jgi:hypothetical protein
MRTVGDYSRSNNSRMRGNDFLPQDVSRRPERRPRGATPLSNAGVHPLPGVERAEQVRRSSPLTVNEEKTRICKVPEGDYSQSNNMAKLLCTM